MDASNAVKTEIDDHLMKTFPPKQIMLLCFSMLNK